MCIALGIEIGFTRQPTFQYPPHLVSPHSLPLFLFLSFPFFHLYLYLYLSLSLSSFLISPFFCLGLAFLFVRDSPSAGLEYPDWARLPPPSIPYSSSLSPAHTSSNTTISHQFNRFPRPVSLLIVSFLHVVFLVTTFTTLFPLPYSRAFSCLPVEVEKNVGLY